MAAVRVQLVLFLPQLYKLLLINFDLPEKGVSSSSEWTKYFVSHNIGQDALFCFTRLIHASHNPLGLVHIGFRWYTPKITEVSLGAMR